MIQLTGGGGVGCIVFQNRLQSLDRLVSGSAMSVDNSIHIFLG
jgi:hypothetical protein